MDLSRRLAAVVCFLGFSVAAQPNLFHVDISTRTYTLNNRGEVVVRVGDHRQFVDVAAQNANLDAKTLVLVYDTVTDALEVVRKDDGTVISTVMTFIDGEAAENAGKTRAYRQAFISLSGSATVSGTAVVSGSAALSGTTTVSGSVVGPVRVAYNGADDIIAYRWDGDFQYSVPSSSDSLNSVVRGHFTLGHEIPAKETP